MTGTWAAALALTKLTPLAASAAPASGPTVSVATGEDYAALVTTVLAPIGRIYAFVKSGNRVVIKPNIGWDRAPEFAATTHPDVVKALVLLALQADAAQVLVFDRPCQEVRRCYTSSGIQAAVESVNDKRAQIIFMEDRKYVHVKIEKGKSFQETDIYKDVLDADCYINVPIAKDHGSSRLTLGLKNAMGVAGGNRGRIHMDLGKRIADLNLVVQPKVTVIDCTRILLHNGPTGGNLKDVRVLNTLIASTDIVAADAYATTLFGLKPAEIPSTQAAYDLGLGEIDLTKVNIVKS
jgi:uncharacterized protein (DUF362 family)